MSHKVINTFNDSRLWRHLIGSMVIYAKSIIQDYKKWMVINSETAAISSRTIFMALKASEGP